MRRVAVLFFAVACGRLAPEDVGAHPFYADENEDGHRATVSTPSLDDADLLLVVGTGEKEYFGGWVGAADLDADGTADAIASGGWYGSGFSVLFGPRSGELTTDDADLGSDPSITFHDPASAGDADGDGDDDLLLSGEFASEAYLLLGPMTSGADVTIADATFEQSAGWSGTATIVPDHDGDGSPDVVMSAIDYGGSRQRGTVYVAPGTSIGTVDLHADATYVYKHPGTRQDELGASISALGDTTGDGIEDLALGAPGSDTFAVYVVEGGAPPGTYSLTDATRLASLSATRTDAFGSSLGASDYDGDGYGDLFVGAPRSKAAVYAFFGPFAEARDTGDADVRWIGDRNLGWWRIAADGDVDADGAPDLLFRGSGLVYLQVGQARGVVNVAEIPSFHATDYDPPSFAFLPDWTGDGGSEVMLGEASFAVGDDVRGRVGVISSETFY